MFKFIDKNRNADTWTDLSQVQIYYVATTGFVYIN